MSLFPVSGCKIYIGAAISDKDADFTAADFASQTWTEITGWSTAGSFGDTAQLITTSLIGSGRDKKQKGTSNAGSMQNVFAFDSTDPGQIALIAAAAPSQHSNFAFKVALNDAVGIPASPTPSPSLRYFIGLAMSAEEANGAANTIRNLNATIEINSNVVRVARNPAS